MKQNMKKFKKILFTLTSFFTIITVPILTISCAKSENAKSENANLYNGKPYDESKFNFRKFKSKFEFDAYKHTIFSYPYADMIRLFQVRDKVDVDKLQSLLEKFVELTKHPEFGISFDKLNNWETWFTFEQFYELKSLILYANNLDDSMVDLLKRQGVWNKSYHWAVGDFAKIVLPIVNKTQKEVDFTTMVRIFDFILNIEYYNNLNKV